MKKPLKRLKLEELTVEQKIGMLICADRRWPEAARSLKKQGAEMILIPTYGVHHARNLAWMCTRAYENECWLAFAHPNQSFIIDPEGYVDAFLTGNVSSILIHDFAPSKSESLARGMFSLRRPDLYI